MPVALVRILLLLVLAVCCGCSGQTQSTSPGPSNDAIQVPKNLVGAQAGGDPKMKSTPPPLTAGNPGRLKRP